MIYDHKCTRCQLSSLSAQTICIEAQVGTSKAMVIGEAPGSNEDQVGVPFVGRAGDKLNKALSAAGLDRSMVTITNAVKCRPPANRAPNLDELEACFAYLVKELEEFQPKWVLTVGGVATQIMVPNQFTSIGNMRGEWIHLTGMLIMPTWHPAYVMRKPIGGEVFTQFRSDVALFADKVNGRS